MTEKEQIVAFHAAITQVVENFVKEYDLSVASAVGVLEIVKREIFTGADAESEDS